MGIGRPGVKDISTINPTFGSRNLDKRRCRCMLKIKLAYIQVVFVPGPYSTYKSKLKNKRDEKGNLAPSADRTQGLKIFSLTLSQLS